MKQRRLLSDQLTYPEAPRWRDGKLWFSDVHAFELRTVDLEGNVETVASLPGRPSGFGFMPDGRLLMGTALDRQLVWIAEAGSARAAFDLTDIAQGLLNDMVVDGEGNAFVGDTGFNMAAGESPRPGRLIHYREDVGASVAAEGLEFPNGCAVTPDGARLFVAETLAHRITRFELAADGTLSDRTLFADLGHAPDGLCLDEEGGLWVALPLANEFVRLDSAGTVTDRLALGRFCVACTFGGDDRKTLFLCSAHTSLEQLARGESRGLIEAVELDLGGAGWP